MAVKTLGLLVNDLRHEIGHSASPAAGINMHDQLVYVLNRAQEELSISYDWPALVVDRDIPVVAGTRYYLYPSDLPFEAVNRVWLIYSTLYGDLTYGIGPAQFALFSSDDGFKSWPIERWMHRSDDGDFEVWPVPSEAPDNALIRMRGTRVIAPMVADSDLCVLPSTAIVLYAAAEILSRDKDAGADLKMGKAKEYLRSLRVRQGSHKSAPFVIGGGHGDGTAHGRVGIDYIPNGYGKGPGG